MRRGQKGGYDSSTLRLQIMSHNFDYVIFIEVKSRMQPFVLPTRTTAKRAKRSVPVTSQIRVCVMGMVSSDATEPRSERRCFIGTPTAAQRIDLTIEIPCDTLYASSNGVGTTDP